jgi:hypothetical protein
LSLSDILHKSRQSINVTIFDIIVFAFTIMTLLI